MNIPKVSSSRFTRYFKDYSIKSQIVTVYGRVIGLWIPVSGVTPREAEALLERSQRALEAPLRGARNESDMEYPPEQISASGANLEGE